MRLKKECRMRSIDLNCDMGESFGHWELGEDSELLRWITSANIACGFHAGDPVIIDRTVRLAADRQVGLGAHPGYPDLQGFGRRDMRMSDDEVENLILYQTGALAGFCSSHGGELVHVKPHGALYNQSARDLRLAEAVARGVKRFSAGLVLVGLAGSALVQAGEVLGLRVANEGYSDRAYEPDGSLRPRTQAGAVIKSDEEACAQAVRLATEGIRVLREGQEQTIRVDTICIHGDHLGSANRAASVRKALESSGIEVKQLDNL
jgi:5-oxoprolinase (ATP-hydrolysing) subunit A